MRSIVKSQEPASLTTHRQSPHSDYNNYEDKDALRFSLANEQRGLCCYCMARIRPDRESMKIEHWHSQSNHSEEQLRYGNLLGACLGGQGQPSALQHCDTFKGERELKWNPADTGHNIETIIHYEADGSIHSSDPTFDTQLNEILNLNLVVLKNNRKAIWVAVVTWWRMEKERIQGPVPRSHILAERIRYSANNGQLEPFSQVAIWWLDQRLARMP